jgi:hypothetical protein
MSTDILKKRAFKDTCLIPAVQIIPAETRAIMDKICKLPYITRETLCRISPPINTRQLAENFLEQEEINDLETWIDSILSS